MKKILVILAIVLGCTGLSFTLIVSQKSKPWPVPESFKKMKNAVVSNPASIAEGKALYNTHCKSCHGTKGLGDGPKAAQLDTESGDFSKATFQSQTDGEILYKTVEGRDDMPSYKKKLPDVNEQWSVINYMRTFKK